MTDLANVWLHVVSGPGQRMLRKGVGQVMLSYPAGWAAPVTERTYSRPPTRSLASATLTMMVGIGGV